MIDNSMITVRAVRVPLVGVACALLLVLAGCGAAEYTYVTNSADRTFFKVPTSWGQIDQKELAGHFGASDDPLSGTPGFWVVGYDAAEQPALVHMLGPHADSPVLLASVQQIPRPARGQLSLDTLRDLFLPVSQHAREQAAADPTSRLSDFGLFVDDVLTPGGGLRGVHTVFRYRLGDGPIEVFNLTAYINDDASKVYQLIVRCSADCYRQRQKEIETVASSFTIRENP